MPDLGEESSRYRDGLTRRSLLRVGTLSAVGAGLSGLLPTKATQAGASRETSCILVWLQGGLSHVDSFDPKPEAPAEIRGTFGTIATRVPGIYISEHLPKLALQQDKFAILRSINPRNGSHGVADAYLMSGHEFNPSVSYPCFGSVIARELGSRQGMPAFVQLGNSVDGRFGGGVAGFLGAPFNPLVLTDIGDRIRSDRHIEGLNGSAEARFKWTSSMLKGPRAQRALDIDAEASRLRDRYGRNSLGQRCLLARRLIEAGTRFVTVTDEGWDTHQDNFTSLSNRLLPRLDGAVSTLLEDLHVRGMLDSTLVIVLSDFGRTPRVNAAGGRDHWPAASVALLAGAGLKTGLTVGATNVLGEQSTESPYLTEDIAATIYSRFAIPLNTTYRTPEGRSVRVNDDGRLIRELV